MNPLPSEVWGAIILLQSHCAARGLRLNNVAIGIANMETDLRVTTFNSSVGPVQVVMPETMPEWSDK